MSASLSSFPISATRAPKTKSQVLILEPDLAVLNYLRASLERNYALSTFGEEKALLDRIESGSEPDLVLIAPHPTQDPLPLLSHIRSTRPHLPIIVLSCSGEVRELERVVRSGVRAIVMKPFIAADIETAIEEHLALADRKPATDAPKEIQLTENNSFVRSSKRMRELEAQAALVARADIPVLILGESGTGKEVLALYTHKMSVRSQHIFLKVNCAAVPADLLESELFGYEQGAFTGAIKTKPGKFEICSGGTIFLDEIGEMPAILQAKLLQVLQDGTFMRLGSRAPMRVDVRVIAATNINMKEAMANKTFREDLYYRLNGFTLSIPCSPSTSCAALQSVTAGSLCFSRTLLQTPSPTTPGPVIFANSKMSSTVISSSETKRPSLMSSRCTTPPIGRHLPAPKQEVEQAVLSRWCAV